MSPTQTMNAAPVMAKDSHIVDVATSQSTIYAEPASDKRINLCDSKSQSG
jgi:hypothetical protein